MRKPVLGVGITGSGEYSWSETRYVYNLWHNMLSRCYSRHQSRLTPSYRGVYVCSKWLHLQKFGVDIEKLPNFGLEGFELDKDLLKLGNLVYSPRYCLFIPQRINTLLWTGKSGKYGRGVHYNHGRFTASLKAKDNRGTSYIGCFATPEEAQLAVKEEKLRYTKSLIREYRRFLPKQVQDNILYKVEHYDDT